jgi:LysR family nitrogen assimilation transcriptional regulator
VRGALAGRVAIGLPPSVAKVLAVPLIREFRQRMPEATLSITEGLSVGMQESVANGRLDIALLYNAAASTDTEITPLLEEDLFLVERQAQGVRAIAKAIALKDIAAMPLVIPSRPNAIRMLVESGLANLGLRPRIALEIDGVAAILELVADGAGSAVLSRNAVATSGRPQAFALRPIAPRLRTKLSLAVSSQRPATLTQKAMLELIQQTARELLA